MDIFLGILAALFGLLLIILLRMVTTFFHELGHALPALIFTRDKVEVYVGSYGDVSKTMNLRIGRLLMHLKINVFDWNIGLCRYEKAPDATWKRVLIILGGPIASLMIAIPLILNLKALQSNSTLFFFAIIFIAAASIDLIVNLIPSSQALKMDGGGAAYSDGYQLLAIIQRKFLPKEAHELIDLMEAKSYQKVLDKSLTLIEQDDSKRYPYDFKIAALKELENFQAAIDTFQTLEEKNLLRKSDYFEVGQLYNKIGDYGEALHFFEHSYQYYYTDPALINAMATSHIQLGNNRKAIKILTASLVTAPDYADTYKNRAEAYDKIWEYELAEQDRAAVEQLTARSRAAKDASETA